MACGSNRIRDGHSSGTPVTRRLQQPTRTAGSGHDPEAPRVLRKAFAPSLFGLAPGGVCRAACVTAGAVRSYRTVSPLPTPSHPLPPPPPQAGEGRVGEPAVCSLWHCPWARTRRMLSGTACPRSPDFPPRQYAGAAVRPTDAGRDGGSGRRRQGPMTRRSKVMVRARAAMERGRWRWSSSSCKVARVDASLTPSTRSGRKWRWNAVTTSWVAES
jgi:hypothetical protein